MRINFDMDGTIADLYGVEDWLKYLIDEDTLPYETATPLLRLSALARRLNNLQKKGFNIAIISWLPKNGTPEYNIRVTEAKIKWLCAHMPSVNWNAIHIVPYGTPKQTFCASPLDILFDDEEGNREAWPGFAYDVNDILEKLEQIKKF